ncbi:MULTISPECIES: helix-turn-helix domain-containing protein [Vibrio]|uniref:helix-turn-helix domain-containing protein n=1 Tax=Vibrio TaxID=662 RepID=UPI00193318F4|nr:helix-turn-helix domain-containing protein [Vibrio sp. S17_S38]
MFNMRNKYGDIRTGFIQAALKQKGFKSMKELASKYDLAPSTFGAVWKSPYERVERIIADELGLEPSDIWPSRYLDDEVA